MKGKRILLSVIFAVALAGAGFCEVQAGSGYIIADSGSRYLTEADVAGLSLREVNYAKNEIFARHGRRFLSVELQTYFDSRDWYVGLYEPKDFDANYSAALLSDWEKWNADYLASIEYSMNPSGYPLDTTDYSDMLDQGSEIVWLLPGDGTAGSLEGKAKAAAEELYQPVLEKYKEGAADDYATWDTVGEGLLQFDPNNPWSGEEMCYAFVDLAGIKDIMAEDIMLSVRGA